MKKTFALLSITDAHVHTNFNEKNETHTGQNAEGWADLSDLGVIHCAGTGARVDSARIVGPARRRPSQNAARVFKDQMKIK